MAGDDILWKKVDRLKEHEPKSASDEHPEPKNATSSDEKLKRRKKPPSKKARTSPVYLSDLTASKRASTPAIGQEGQPASVQASQIEAVRRVVKHTGKEIAYVRLTPGEKRRLAAIVYAYKRQEIKTSENELLRIALNYLLDDYRASGKESALAQVLTALND